MANWYYRDGGHEVGPLTPAEMKALVADGTIDEATRVRRGDDGEWTPADRVPGLLRGGAAVAEAVPEGDATGGLIPYKNPQALIAYYLGLFSLAPVIGLPMGIAAFVLGLKGLKARKRNPAVSGAAHAWIGIGCGGTMALVWTLFIGWTVIALVAGGNR